MILIAQQLRQQYLGVLYQLLMNCTDYLTNLHKQKEILKIATEFSNSENIDDASRAICRKILQNCRTLLELDPDEVIE